MEKKKILKKLFLNKDVVSSLNDSDMNHLRGGDDDPYAPTNTICLDYTCGGTCNGTCDEDTCGACPSNFC